jgi:hypothetical protein
MMSKYLKPDAKTKTKKDKAEDDVKTPGALFCLYLALFCLYLALWHLCLLLSCLVFCRVFELDMIAISTGH